MADSYPLSQAAAQLDEIVERTRTGRERVLLTDGEAPIAAVISISDLEELQRAEDDADIARCEQVKTSATTGLSHNAFMALLAAEDTKSA